jgi:hypothetical protein
MALSLPAGWKNYAKLITLTNETFSLESLVEIMRCFLNGKTYLPECLISCLRLDIQQFIFVNLANYSHTVMCDDFLSFDNKTAYSEASVKANLRGFLLVDRSIKWTKVHAVLCRDELFENMFDVEFDKPTFLLESHIPLLDEVVNSGQSNLVEVLTIMRKVYPSITLSQLCFYINTRDEYFINRYNLVRRIDNKLNDMTYLEPKLDTISPLKLTYELTYITFEEQHCTTVSWGPVVVTKMGRTQDEATLLAENSLMNFAIWISDQLDSGMVSTLVFSDKIRLKFHGHRLELPIENSNLSEVVLKLYYRAYSFRNDDLETWVRDEYEARGATGASLYLDVLADLFAPDNYSERILEMVSMVPGAMSLDALMARQPIEGNPILLKYCETVDWLPDIDVPSGTVHLSDEDSLRLACQISNLFEEV